ncbi:HEPN domain protein [Thermoproteus uzoniensis 768-20]|uniref:HEPN domain protein n=1 Tax=Thermoproteus uzoniensis (strain 768-20) TaxID=999630 RepID=F2L0Z5_THEU7|nr:HEPN domain-containing protein [Thermoproteus uzoniensis]AEA11544.1 HEPN domain protein [Thermoproteus uzoniensis 768-20]
MSLEVAEEYLKRAEEYLKAARTLLGEGLYNAAAVSAEIAAQLSVKALLIKLGVEPPRTHAVRTLLGVVAKYLGGEAADFAAQYRRELIILEDARSLGQYGVPGVDRERAEIAVKTAEAVVDLVKRLWSR